MTRSLSALVLVAGLTACSSGASSPAPVAGTVLPAAVSVPPPFVALGDSITQGWDGAQYLTTTAYPSLVASALGMTLVNLAIGGESSGPPITMTAANGHGILADEVPGIPANAALVSLFVGTVDENQTIIGNDDPATTPTLYAQNVAAIIAGIHARAPQARIVLAAPIDLVDRAPWASVPNRPVYAAMALAMKQALIATGLPVVDLGCEPAMYDEGYYANGNLHPEASLHAIIATDFLRVIQHGVTVTGCAYNAAL